MAREGEGGSLGEGAVGPTGPSTRRQSCVYRRGGNCTTHGPGAQRYWRPLGTPRRGPRGNMVTREYYYSCDIGPRGRGRLRQARLPFRNFEDNPSQEDSGRGRNPDLDIDISTTSEGQ